MSHLIGDWLAAWASAVLARPRLSAFATLALGALAGYYAAGNLGVNTDTANMIAATVPWRGSPTQCRPHRSQLTKKVMMTALVKSMKNAPTSGTMRNARGAGP